jgi:electron transfer flavoprotein alpha subunit
MAPLTGGEIFVYVPLHEGSLGDAGRGILAEGAKLAEVLGAPWRASCLAAPDPSAYEPFGAYGVPEILEITCADPLADYPEALADAVAGAARHAGARMVLLAHDDAGSAAAPALAARLGAALCTEALGFERLDGGLRVARQLLGQQLVDHRLWDGNDPLVLTASRKVLSAVPVPSVRPTHPRRTPWAFAASPGSRRVRVTERIPPDPRTVDVSEAELIFCAGKGLDRESFGQLEELARLLGASLGVTRPVYDRGWAGFERMIGQTGKTVAPRLYLGVGISGSMHHVGGITGSKTIVSLNVDPKAPVFAASDEGFVADATEVLPRLLDKVRAASRDGR